MTKLIYQRMFKPIALKLENSSKILEHFTQKRYIVKIYIYEKYPYSITFNIVFQACRVTSIQYKIFKCVRFLSLYYATSYQRIASVGVNLRKTPRFFNHSKSTKARKLNFCTLLSLVLRTTC